MYIIIIITPSQDYEWKTHEDLCRSDHFTVIQSSNTVEEDISPNMSNFKKADIIGSVSF